MNFEKNINKVVRKKSNKPFKSGQKHNTVRGVIPHPMLPGKYAYLFYDDCSYVRCDICKIVELLIC